MAAPKYPKPKKKPRASMQGKRVVKVRKVSARRGIAMPKRY